MPHHYPPLELWTRRGDAEGASRLPAPDSAVPCTFEAAGKIFNATLLAGEALGVPTSDALQILEDTFDLPDNVPHLYFEDELPVLVRLLSDSLARLSAAIDAEGRPNGPDGALLAQSPRFETDGEGRIRTRAGRYLIFDLIAGIERLRAFLAYAADHGLLVRVMDSPQDLEQET